LTGKLPVCPFPSGGPYFDEVESYCNVIPVWRPAGSPLQASVDALIVDQQHHSVILAQSVGSVSFLRLDVGGTPRLGSCPWTDRSGRAEGQMIEQAGDLENALHLCLSRKNEELALVLGT
jgi:hypothetical protein